MNSAAEPPASLRIEPGSYLPAERVYSDPVQSSVYFYLVLARRISETRLVRGDT